MLQEVRISEPQRLPLTFSCHHRVEDASAALSDAVRKSVFGGRKQRTPSESG